MASRIPEKYCDVFDKKAFASLATLMADGRPQVTPAWVDFDGIHILVNTMCLSLRACQREWRRRR
jgi:predicted pyridoxine 5'-phosphate oxidase superfamily flavin-nucleotide-binding protein